MLTKKERVAGDILLAESRANIRKAIIHHLSKVLKMPERTFSYDSALIDYGIESLQAFELNNILLAEIGVELPFTAIVKGMTINQLVDDIYHRKMNPTPVAHFPQGLEVKKKTTHSAFDYSSLPTAFYDIKHLPQYRKGALQRTVFTKALGQIPYFRAFSSASTDTIMSDNKELINFASYNYLGFCGHDEVNLAAKQAIEQYGTSASSSRIVSGEKLLHQQLEEAIAKLYGVDDAVVFVSGYGTNVGVIDHLMGRKDLIIHDGLSHNSIVTGARLSQAKRIHFPHNHYEKLEEILIEKRHLYEKVLLITEGLFSMDGDIPDIKKLIALKNKYKCLLMVDEAHSLGVLGETGLGLRQYASIDVNDVDIWMGTLSKTLGSCGGFIAGCQNLITDIKYAASAFMFSVGLAPSLAASALKAIELLVRNPEPVRKLRKNSLYCLHKMSESGFDTGVASGNAIIPVIIGHSINTAKISNELFARGVNVQSIIYPGVSDECARLRFFISALHSERQIDNTISILKKTYQEVYQVSL